MQRADQVRDFGGYAATLTGFANAFGDKHVRARPLLQVSSPEWAGVILARQGERWVVVDLSIEGVSLVNHFRKTFARALVNMSPNQLIDHLRKQLPAGEP